MKVTIVLYVCFSLVILYILPVDSLQTKVLPIEYDIARLKYHTQNTQNDGFFIKDLSKPPTSRQATESDVTFRLSNHKNVDSYELLHCDDFEELVNSEIFDETLPNYFITHGWSNSGDSEVNKYIRRSVLSVANVNVFVVDWSGVAGQVYEDAQGSVKVIGDFIGDYINKIMDNYNQTPNNFRLVGHSLGAHVSGNAGTKINGNVKYIIGLDPAGPLFTIDQTDNRLDPTDAQYVQIIHTNTGLLSFVGSIGHSDFYPNGGTWQPGCGHDITGACAHNRAFEFLAESIVSGGFLSTNCDSYDDYLGGLCSGNITANMGGFDLDTTVTGDFYLETNDIPPFSKK